MSTRPYLIRAMWQWAHDNGFTPQLLVDATGAEVAVPVASVESGRIVLNVHDRAVVDLEMGNDLITFSAGCGGAGGCGFGNLCEREFARHLLSRRNRC